MTDLPSSLNEKLRSAIFEIAGRLSAYTSVTKIILYGSCAAGTNGPDSDVDLAAFLKSGTPCGPKEFIELNRLISPFNYDVQLQVFSEDELEDPCGIVDEVVSFGVVLFDRTCVA